MLKLLRRLTLDPGLLVAVGIATFAAWPFLTRVSLPTFTDAEMHAHRTFEIMSAWQAGVPYLRWAPDLFYAYGYPVFHYYAPFSYYLGAAYGWLCCGITGAVPGVKFVLVASLYLGSVGMYVLVRDRWGGAAGGVSAAAFVLAPYMVYIDPHARGDAPETLALAFAPWMLWAFSRLRRTAAPGDMIVAALTLAALVLSHNLMALIFFGLLLAWMAWDVTFGHTFVKAWVVKEGRLSRDVRWRVLIALGAAVGLGLSLSAAMWLPAVLERNAVQFRNVAGGTYFDFRRYFIGVRELFAPALLFDLGATQMRFNYSVGVAQWTLALFGTLTVFWPRTRRLSVLFFALAALVLMYFMLPASLQVWEAIPPLAYLQFPTRLLGPAAVMLGVLAGAGVSWTKSLPWRYSPMLFGALAVAWCGAFAMPLMYPPPWPDFGSVSAQRILATELNGRGIGTTSANDFLPIGVISVPGPQDSLIQSYATDTVDKVNRATLPGGTTVTPLDQGPEHNHYRVAGLTEFVLRLYTFYFPGWTAYVDGAKTPITVSEPEGWITFWVPAGEHDVWLRLENTPPRWVGWVFTTLGAIGLAALVFWGLRLRVASLPVEAWGWKEALAMGAVLVGLMVVRGWADQAGWWRVHSTGNEVLVAQHQHFAALEQGVALLAYDLPVAAARPGDKVPLKLYWKAQAPVRVNLRVFVHFIGPDRQLWGQSDKWNPADFPTSRFPLDLYVRDEHEVALRPDAPPGEYRVVVGLWDADTGARMHVLDPNGAPTEADGILLPVSFTVRP